MNLKAVVRYLGDWAHYAITPENKGIYHAHLTKYEGAEIVTPPEDILLVRGPRQWVGSYNERSLLDELGRCIEERMRAGEPNDR